MRNEIERMIIGLILVFSVACAVASLDVTIGMFGLVGAVTSTAWFSVDKEGLSKLMEGRHRAFIVNELLQNAWDTDATEVDVLFERQTNSPFVEITVTDNNPEGFNDIAHAYTLFAESEKKVDPTKRGRFNMGEKMVLALARNARISTTSGSVIFDEGKGYRLSRRAGDKTETGSVVWMEVRMSVQEEQECKERVHWVLPPEENTEGDRLDTTFNGEVIEYREPLVSGLRVPMTTVADTRGDGILRTTKRQTTIEIHEPREGEVPMVYEMGLPVVELPDDRYSVNVMQKVPMDLSRDNIPPSYRRALRGEVLNLTADLLTKQDVKESWVKEALEHDRLGARTIDTTMDTMFGEKRAIFNPQDAEANAGATVAGYTVMTGGALSSAAWKNVRDTGNTVSSSRVDGGAFESHQHSMRNATPTEMRLKESEWTDEMKQVVCLAARMCEHRGVSLGDITIVRHPKTKGGNYGATWGSGSSLTFNLSTLGRRWFNMETNLSAIVTLICHEMAHSVGGHFDQSFYGHIEDSAGVFTVLALENKRFFNPTINRKTLEQHASYRGGGVSLLSGLTPFGGGV